MVTGDEPAIADQEGAVRRQAVRCMATRVAEQPIGLREGAGKPRSRRGGARESGGRE